MKLPLYAPITVVLFVGLIRAQAVVPDESEYRIRTTAELVMLDVAAENAQGKPVGDLTKDRFKIREDGKPQSISTFSHEDQPVSIGLVVDQSGSMKPKIKEVISAALAFVRASNPQDEMFVVNFNERASLGLPTAIPFSDDVNLLANSIASTRAEGRTALNDAVILALNHVGMGTKQRKAILLISDGGDNVSVHSEAEMMAMAEQVQATIYTIGLFDASDPDSNPALLRRLAAISGGETYLPDNPTKMPEILAHIAHEIRSRYMITYVPARKNASGGVRRIRVEATGENGSKLVVRTRTRYRLPDLDGSLSPGATAKGGRP
jgi:Ca-activated chloride channel homolog